MSIVTADIAVTLDGYGAGTNQRLEKPFGDIEEERLHAWMLAHADESPDEIAAITEASAYIMGRNMFSPGRGEWDPAWRGWWGEDPPYHAPVFVLTHHEREPLPMQGGTTLNQFLAAGLLDELRLHVVPFISGVERGSRIFEGVPATGLEIAAVRTTPHVTHLTYRRPLPSPAS